MTWLVARCLAEGLNVMADSLDSPTALVAVLFALGQFASISPSSPSMGGQPLAVLATFLVGAAVFLSVPLVGVWAVLMPGANAVRFAISLLGWGLGGLLIVHYWGKTLILLALPLLVLAVAITLLLGSLGVLRAMSFRAIWVASSLTELPLEDAGHGRADWNGPT